MRYLRSALVLLALGAWAAGPLAGASAARLLAPTYESSDPERGAMMDHPPSEVRVTFSEPLDPSSSMNVLDECGNEIDSGPAEVQLKDMTVGIGKTPSGWYRVVYKAVGVAGGAVTGSSGGEFEFMVHHGTPCKGSKKHDHHDPKKKDHDDHDRDRDGDHGDHGDGGPGHAGMGHSGMSGMSSGDHGGHTMGVPDGAGGHGDHGKHGPRKPPATGGDNPPLASGGDGLPVSASPEAVLVGLGLALAVGVLGGWLLRMTGTPA
ncbi:MAG: copper resistance protein CopC [Actinomycetota bacterium]|nr:copper resistance protein CopC [Actinomycetota bacterium]